jgi:ABC-2 type transport system ATP-binding protein
VAASSISTDTAVYDPKATVQTVQLTKRYGNNRGIQNVNISLYPGEVYGFLGPNGAGKTTTIRCILDLLRPTSGDLYLFGKKVQGSTAHLRTNVGYVAGEVRLTSNLTGEELIRLNEGLKGRKAQHLSELTQNFEIELKRKVRTLSKGNKQKLALLLAFMFDNELYILDEPTSGLDPLKQQYLFQLIEQRRALGASILLSSHVLSEVEQSCSRVGVVSAGQLLTQESMETLINKQLRNIQVRFAPDQPLDQTFWSSQAGIINPRWPEPHLLEASLQPSHLNNFVHSLSNYQIDDIEIQKSSLEEVFFDYYRINQMGGGQSE